MVVIGGAVVASLIEIPLEFQENQKALSEFQKKGVIPMEPKFSDAAIRKYYNEIAYPDSDIDIYIYGLSEEKFMEKVRQIHNYLKKIHGEVLVVRTPFTITFCTTYPNRHIQVKLNLIFFWKKY